MPDNYGLLAQKRVALAVLIAGLSFRPGLYLSNPGMHPQEDYETQDSFIALQTSAYLYRRISQ